MKLAEGNWAVTNSQAFGNVRGAGAPLQIGAPVRFLWRDTEGALHMGFGITGHLSRQSVYVLTQQVPSPGAQVQVMVEMPPAGANHCARRLTGKGVAVRVEHENGRPAAFSARVGFQSCWAYSTSETMDAGTVNAPDALSGADVMPALSAARKSFFSQ